MKQRLNVAVLSSRLPEDIWLINKISDVCEIRGIVLPNKDRFKEFDLLQVFRKTVHRSGVKEAFNQSFMYLYRRLFEQGRDEREMKRIFSEKSFETVEQEGVNTLYVDNINAPEVVAFLQQLDIDVIVASGISILKPHIINAVDCKILNLHPGLAPDYRGRYGAYWPVYYEEPELVGVTIHFIDEGIDTGPILMQGRVQYNWNDYVKTITYKQHQLGGELMIRCLQNYEAAAEKAARKKGENSRNFRAMGICEYMKAKRWMRRNRRGQVINGSPETEEPVDLCGMNLDALSN